MALNKKQQRFADEYLIDLNSAQAAIRAGYSHRSARQIGEQLLKRADVQEYLQRRMQERAERTGITQDMVVRELARIGFADIRKVVQWGSRVLLPVSETDVEMVVHGIAVRDSTEIDDDTAAAIAEISEGREGLKVKFHNKHGALVDLGKHLGIFSPRNHDELDAELKRLEIERRRLEVAKLRREEGDSEEMLERIEVEVVDARRPATP